MRHPQAFPSQHLPQPWLLRRSGTILGFPMKLLWGPHNTNIYHPGRWGARLILGDPVTPNATPASSVWSCTLTIKVFSSGQDVLQCHPFLSILWLMVEFVWLGLLGFVYQRASHAWKSTNRNIILSPGPGFYTKSRGFQEHQGTQTLITLASLGSSLPWDLTLEDLF